MLILIVSMLAQDPILERQERIAKLVRTLDLALDRLIPKAEARDDKDALRRMKAAREILRGKALQDQIAQLQEELKEGRYGAAQESADQVSRTLAEIVAALVEVQSDICRIDWLRAQIAKIDKLIKSVNGEKQKPESQDEARKIEKELKEGDAPQAAGEMKKGADQSPSDAAKDAYRRARNFLQDDVDDLTKRAKDEELKRLVEELNRLLEMQKSIREGARPMMGLKSLDRSQIGTARRLSHDQKNCRIRVDEIRKQIALEHADAFGYVLSLVSEEMNDSAVKLSDAVVDAEFSALMDSIIRRLSLLIEVWNTPEAKTRGRSGPSGRPTPGKGPIVPDLIELNLICKLQEQVLAQTTLAKSRMEKSPAVSERDERILRRLSEEQRGLTDLMHKLIEKCEGRDQRQEQGIRFQDSDPKDESDPDLTRVLRLMEEAEGHLQGARVEPATWRQREIIEALRRLLRRQKETSPDCRGDSERRSHGLRGQPEDFARDPHPPERRGSAFESNFEGGRGWSASLPSRTRLAVIESLNRRDLFMPEYDELIREYFGIMMEFR